MMFKRNEGYALSYVLVVLLVLCIIATAVMAPPLRNLQQQQASIARMQDKYAAQGLIEQVVAQLEHTTTAFEDSEILALGTGNGSITIDKEGDLTYIIKGESDNCIVTAKIQLIENTTSANSEESENTEGSEEAEETTQFLSYTVTYLSYDISYKTGGAE